MYSNELIKSELAYIELNFEFSDQNEGLQQYLYESGLIELDPETDLVFITCEGELLLGNTKEELWEKYGDEAWPTYAKNTKSNNEGEEDEF